jgi:Gluconate 2-dehydrogenase subunit 3
MLFHGTKVAVNRRQFLRYGLFGGVLLTAGGVGLVAWPTKKTYRPTRPLKVLDEREFAILAAVAARTVGAPGADPVEITHGCDLALTCNAPDAQKEFKQLLGLFENALAGLILDGHLGAFTGLSPEKQDAVLAGWRDSGVAVRRTGYTALRKLTQAAHYANPATWAQVGYNGPPQISQPVPT